MANSVVKVTDVTDDVNNDSLLLLVGEDGTVIPDKQTVEAYLNSKAGPTNIQIMRIDKSDMKSIDVSVDNVTYMPDNMEVANTEDVVFKVSEPDMEEVARNLHSFRLDHDYTPLTSPKRSTSSDEVDELAKTLSILHGSEDNELAQSGPAVITRNATIATPAKPAPKVNIISSITIPPSSRTATAKPAQVTQSLELVGTIEKEEKTPQKMKGKAKILHSKPVKTKSNKTVTPKVRQTRKTGQKIEKEEESADEDSEESDFESDFDVDDDDDDEDDSDFNIEEEVKAKQTTKKLIKIPKSDPRTPKSQKDTHKLKKVKKEKVKETVEESVKEESEKVVPKDNEVKDEKPSETKSIEPGPEAKQSEKKLAKKEKKPPKPIPNDFALFSTPDIIRRVGGKEPSTPVTPEAPGIAKFIKSPEFVKLGESLKPAKITQESRSKSASTDNHHTPSKSRLSLDSKLTVDKEKQHKNSIESKNKDFIDAKSKERKGSIDMKTKNKTNEDKVSRESRHSIESKRTLSPVKSSDSSYSSESLEPMPSAEDVRAIIMNEDTRTYTMNTIPIPDVSNSNMDASNLNLDGSGLDLDQSILDNINNDMISEDILYQVAQQLVSNTDIQNAIDKGINEGVLDTRSIQEAMEVQSQTSGSDGDSIYRPGDIVKEGTQIVRPDGRVVVIPPIERPATRSRNKTKEETRIFKSHKPLDDEHVSGNELDSSNDEEESEDDPNKLWCTCNQPHNNRFMICCDTCEEWYHGKCVNITKAMGQQMESEGKEWICVFCKNPSLRRPKAAAKRVRKASRNSRASTDSNSSLQKSETKEKTGSSPLPCVVCQKPARKNSIYCSETCILAHAQGIERVVVYDKSSGNMLTGSKAPSTIGLDQWLKTHPRYEVVKSTGKVLTAKVKPASFTQSKLKLVKNPNNEGVSLAVQQKGISLGVLKHAPKQHPSPNQHHQQNPAAMKNVKIIKVYSREALSKEPKAKLIQAQPMPSTNNKVLNTTPTKPKITVQTVLTPKIPKPKESPKENKTPSSSVKPFKLKHKEKSKEKSKDKEDQQTNQENVRENVQKTIFEQLMVRLKDESNIKLTEEEIKNISIDVETELHKCFGDTGQKYKNKYRSLIFNIKDAKNQTLWRRICEKTISSYELVRLSPDDMASQELAKWREQEAKHQLDMIKKSELELLNSSTKFLLKTHKGEEVLEDNRPGAKGDNAEVIKSLTEGVLLDSGEKDKGDGSRDRDRKNSSKHSHKDKTRDRDRLNKDKKDRSKRSSSRDRDRSRKRSRSRDHSRHDRKKDKRSRSHSRDRDRHRKSHKSSKHKKNINASDNLDKRSKEILEQLNKIAPPVEDKLWKHVSQDDVSAATADSDSDHEIPSSTVTIPTPPRISESEDYQPSEIKPSRKTKEVPSVEEGVSSPPPKFPDSEILWSGSINMIDVAQITITAHEVSGDCSGLGKELPENLDVIGRISPDTVWDYISKIKCSNSKVISLVRLSATNVEEQMPYLALYSYLSSKGRLGVVRSTSKAIKDFYIMPLASQKPIPQVLLPLNGPGFEEARPALLLGVIIRDKRKRLFLEQPLRVTPPIPHKKTKVDVIIQPPAPPTAPPRSYTPPPIPVPSTSTPKTELRISKLPLPPTTPVTPPDEEEEIEGGDEPYSPEDSDPETTAAQTTTTVPPPLVAISTTQITVSETNLTLEQYPTIPGLGDGLPSTKLDIQRQMDELNKKIEMQKSEITSITKNIATAGSEIGTSALASIALPSNLQQILDSIKTIGASNDATDLVEKEPPIPGTIQPDLTIPLMIPKTFTRPLNPGQKPDIDTIPLNLPTKPKIKPASVNSPICDGEKSNSVLSSLTEEDLIKKAAEMLREDETSGKKGYKSTPPPNFKTTPPPPILKATPPPPIYKTTPPPCSFYKTTPPPGYKTMLPAESSPPPKKSKFDMQLPPVPGVD